jgi:hypothetical protein
MAGLSVRRGKKFERKIAKQLRTYFPEATVRRSLQADRAYDSDLVVEGAQLPRVLCHIWWELNDEREPNPRRKLDQAHRDAALAEKRRACFLFPLVIWHKYRSPDIHVTLQLDTLARLLRTQLDYLPQASGAGTYPVQLELNHFLSLVKLVHGRDTRRSDFLVDFAAERAARRAR